MIEYKEFLKRKVRRFDPVGFSADDIHSTLYPFQAAITRWAIRKGRAAIFAGCGMGKTLMQVEWAKHMTPIGEQCLIVAPLCVAEQTIEEGRHIGTEIVKVSAPTNDRIQITNYEKLSHFVGHPYTAIVLDESSILKHVDGKTRTLLLNEFTHIPFRLCCTATPSPNDIAEIGNHSQFLGVLSHAEMLATFFVHDDQEWRLKGHAHDEFWKWLASWCIYVRKPQDIGFEDDRFDLPPIHMHEHKIKADFAQEGFLFAVPVSGLKGRRDARKNTIEERVERARKIIAASDEPFLVWCGLNEESHQMKAILENSAIEIEGKDGEERRLWALSAWASGEVQTLISKPKIFGFGMNFQHCPNIIFLGLGDSWESYYQSIRRSWRFGQKNPVHVHIVISDAEMPVLQNIEHKEREAEHMAERVIERIGDIERKEIAGEGDAVSIYSENAEEDALGRWKMMQGDCVERIKEIRDESIGLSVFSPPFAALYTYTASDRDMGNSRDYEEFFGHFRFLIPELLRVTMPGRRCCVHVQQVALKKVRDGVIGWMDFRADVVRNFVDMGWVYDGEVVLDKDPQAQAIRTKSKALLFAQLRKDSSWSRPAMADYILLFRKDGDNPEPINPEITNEEWIHWARPVWYGIRENDTLHVAEAREEKDERHICPLQLGTIERCVKLWSNAGDMVLSPFAGIGSEGYQSVKLGRKFIGIELKEAYFRAACKNMKSACQPTIFDSLAQEGEKENKHGK